MIVYKEDIAKKVSQLQKNKSAGPNRVSAENFINSPTIIYEHIATLFTAMFRYSYISDDFMHIIIVEI